MIVRILFQIFFNYTRPITISFFVWCYILNLFFPFFPKIFKPHSSLVYNIKVKHIVYPITQILHKYVSTNFVCVDISYKLI